MLVFNFYRTTIILNPNVATNISQLRSEVGCPCIPLLQMYRCYAARWLVGYSFVTNISQLRSEVVVTGIPFATNISQLRSEKTTKLYLHSTLLHFAPGIVADSPQGRRPPGSRSGRATGGSSCPRLCCPRPSARGL